MVEVRQRWHTEWIILPAFDPHRQPEAQLAQPHRERIPIDAEDRTCDHAAPDLDRITIVAEDDEHRGKPLERVHEECTRTACRIEHPDALEPVPQDATT